MRKGTDKGMLQPNKGAKRLHNNRPAAGGYPRGEVEEDKDKDYRNNYKDKMSLKHLMDYVSRLSVARIF